MDAKNLKMVAEVKNIRIPEMHSMLPTEKLNVLENRNKSIITSKQNEEV